MSLMRIEYAKANNYYDNIYSLATEIDKEILTKYIENKPLDADEFRKSVSRLPKDDDENSDISIEIGSENVIVNLGNSFSSITFNGKGVPQESKEEIYKKFIEIVKDKLGIDEFKIIATQFTHMIEVNSNKLDIIKKYFQNQRLLFDIENLDYCNISFTYKEDNMKIRVFYRADSGDGDGIEFTAQFIYEHKDYTKNHIYYKVLNDKFKTMCDEVRSKFSSL